MEVKTIAKKWGSSIGIIIPKEVVDEAEIRENDEIIVNIDKGRPKAGVLWGFGKNKFKKTSQEIKNESKKGWLSQSDKKREEAWKKQK